MTHNLAFLCIGFVQGVVITALIAFAIAKFVQLARRWQMHEREALGQAQGRKPNGR